MTEGKWNNELAKLIKDSSYDQLFPCIGYSKVYIEDYLKQLKKIKKKKHIFFNHKIIK